MRLTTTDWIIMTSALAAYVALGLFARRGAGKSYNGFFLGHRSLPWWLLGTSMAATTLAITPHLVAGLVRRDGVFGNWVWWASLLAGTTTAFLFARLWRRSRVLTDLEFYELRYSGKPAAFLRAFRGTYLGLLVNVFVMANVMLAAFKLGEVLLGLPALQSLTVVSVVTLAYSLAGGFSAVALTQLVQFVVALAGSIWAAVFLLGLPEVGGLARLISHPDVAPKLALVPDFGEVHGETFMAAFLFPLLVQWWSGLSPGTEPGGAGAVAQRALAAKSEAHAVGASLLFNVLHFAVRPWPWILVALASLVVFPLDAPDKVAAAKTAIARAGGEHRVDEATRLAARGVTSLRAAFPQVPEAQVTHDLAYPALLTRLPAGLLGLVVTGLVAALMSTIAAQANWGASVVVNDLYHRFLHPAATERQRVGAGRLATVALVVTAGALALLLQDALSSFALLLQVGAGTGLIFLARWFWWRVNAAAEITALAVSGGLALVFFLWQQSGGTPPSGWEQLLWVVVVTTVAWVLVSLLTRPTDEERLRDFYQRVQPGGPGWRHVLERAEHERQQIRDPKLKPDLVVSLLASAAASVSIGSLLFAIGYALYGQPLSALGLLMATFVGVTVVIRCWRRLSFRKAAAGEL